MADPFAVTLDSLADDPHPIWHGLRRRGPIVWVPAFEGWVITSRAEAIAAMRDAEAFTVDDPRFTTAQVLGRNMLSTDGSEHSRHRSPFVQPYRPNQVVVDWTSWLSETATHIIQGFADRGTAELRTDLAGPLAVAAICRSLDLRGVEAAEVLGWYNDLASAIQALSAGLETDGAVGALRQLAAAVHRTIAESDTSVLRTAAGAGLALEEVVANAAVLMFGAIETSEGATANALLHLLSDHAALSAVSADDALLANALEESIRLEPSVAQLDRYATRDLQFAGVRICQGDFVMISLAAANRDPAVFPEPDRFRPDRDNAGKHVTFAQGPHACIGIHLARLETLTAVRTALRLLPDLTLDVAASTRPAGLVFRKPNNVTATWRTR